MKDGLSFSPSFDKLAKALLTAQSNLNHVLESRPAASSLHESSAREQYVDLASLAETVTAALNAAGIEVVQSFSAAYARAGWTVTVETLLQHESGEWVRSTLSFPPLKVAPQDVGSVVPYARSCGLQAICCVVPEEGDLFKLAEAARAATAPSRPARRAPLAVIVRAKLAELRAAIEPDVCAAREWYVRNYEAARRWSVAVIAVCVLLSCMTWLSGNWLERGQTISGTIAFPNFPVTVPSEYAVARDRIRAMVRGDGSVTLLAPSTPFAAYTWGAFGTDFLMSYLGTPTIFRFYWPEDEPVVQNYLASILDTNADRFSVATALAGMRVGATLVHNDGWSWNSLPVRPETYGNVVWTSGDVSVVKPLFKPAPMLAFSTSPITTVGSSDALRIYTGFGRSTLGRPAKAPPIADCNSAERSRLGRHAESTLQGIPGRRRLRARVPLPRLDRDPQLRGVRNRGDDLARPR